MNRPGNILIPPQNTCLQARAAPRSQVGQAGAKLSSAPARSSSATAAA
jgi:hypothetical protein